jgi:hypothetical protein
MNPHAGLYLFNNIVYLVVIMLCLVICFYHNSTTIAFYFFILEENLLTSYLFFKLIELSTLTKIYLDGNMFIHFHSQEYFGYM